MTKLLAYISVEVGISIQILKSLLFQPKFLWYLQVIVVENYRQNLDNPSGSTSRASSSYTPNYEDFNNPNYYRKLDARHTGPPKFPQKYGRRGQFVNILVPRKIFLKCTERNCNEVIPGLTLALSKKYLDALLRTIHGLSDIIGILWCNICKKEIQNKVNNHDCLHNINYFDINKSKVNLP